MQTIADVEVAIVNRQSELMETTNELAGLKNERAKLNIEDASKNKQKIARLDKKITAAQRRIENLPAEVSVLKNESRTLKKKEAESAKKAEADEARDRHGFKVELNKALKKCFEARADLLNSPTKEDLEKQAREINQLRDKFIEKGETYSTEYKDLTKRMQKCRKDFEEYPLCNKSLSDSLKKQRENVCKLVMRI